MQLAVTRPSRSLTIALGCLLLGPLFSDSAPGQDLLWKFEGGDQLDLFGRAVAIVGDLNGDGHDEILMGARDEDGAAVDSGRVYIYSGQTGALLKTHDGEAQDDYFGVAVASLGLLDNDAVPDYGVGARRNDESASDAGKVYVYSGATQTLLHQHTGVILDSYLGWSVAGAGDVDADGYDDYVAGAPRHFGDTGKSYVYSGVDGSLIYTFTGESTGDFFGLVTDGAGDVNQDGYDDVLVGAPFNDVAGANSGRTYVFSGHDGLALYILPGERNQDEFGTAVSGVGDLDQDGYDDFLIGAMNGGPFFEGRAFLYSGFDASIIVTFTGPEGLDAFGATLSDAGDVNGDGVTDLLIGASNFDAPATEVGEAYLYCGDTFVEMYCFNGEAAQDRFGISVASGGDVNNDGFDDMAVGAYLHDGGGQFDAGAGYVFAGNDLFLKATPKPISEGNTLSLTTSGGPPGALAMMFITSVNGSPTFLRVPVPGTFNLQGQWMASGTMPDPEGATEIGLRTLALSGGVIIDSNDELIAIDP